MFTTPEERAAIERNLLQPEEEILEEEAPPPETIVFNGIILKNDGSTTVWVNQQMLHYNLHTQAFSAEANKLRGLDLPVVLHEQDGKIVYLKPGEKIETDKPKEIFDAFQE